MLSSTLKSPLRLEDIYMSKQLYIWLLQSADTEFISKKKKKAYRKFYHTKFLNVFNLFM